MPPASAAEVAAPAPASAQARDASGARSRTCTRCRGAMQAASLEGHYGQHVEVDLCPRCHLLWFDDTESVRLSGLGWIDLLRRMHGAPPASEPEPAGELRCVRCSGPLKPVRNLSRFGRTAAEECRRGHGYLQSFGQLLAERGLVRPMQARDRQALRREGRAPNCLNCGGEWPPVTAETSCSWCGSALLVFDVKQLLASLTVRHGLPLPPGDARVVAWHCKACGDAVDVTQASRCERCGHAVLAPSLSDALPFVDALEPQLRGMRPRAPRPHGERLRDGDGYRATTFFRWAFRPLGLDRIEAALGSSEPAPLARPGRNAPIDRFYVVAAMIVVVVLLAIGHALWGR